MEKDAAHMLALAQADAQWVTETMGDNLDYGASLAEPPGASHHLVRGSTPASRRTGPSGTSTGRWTRSRTQTPRFTG